MSVVMSVIVDTICPVDRTFRIDLDTEGFARYLMALKGMRNRVEKVGENDNGSRFIEELDRLITGK